MSNTAILVGREVPTNTVPYTLVYLATHDGEGKRLPYRYRSFISFKFDNEWIEDFNFIAFIDGDRMQRNLTGEFEDLTSTYEVLDGLFYHSTHFRTNTIHFTLMSDEIDARLMEKFKHHFSPGKTAELILSEYPNRAIQARLALPPEMSMLPFEKKIELNIAGTKYETSVTNYKGTVDLEFIMDEPYWYSIINIFGQVTTGANGLNIYANSWDGTEDFYNDPDKLKDVLKIVYEDGIPLYHMIASPMLFGNDVYAAAGGSLISTIYKPITAAEYKDEPGYHNTPYTKEGLEGLLYWTGGIILDTAAANIKHNATIAGAYVTTTTNSNLMLPPGEANAIYLYYAGTAPAPIKLKFTIPINIDKDSKKVTSLKTSTYNSIFFESKTTLELRMTTPSFITSYNKVIDILNRNESGRDWEKLRDEIRDEVRHSTIRGYIIRIINTLENSLSHAESIDESTNQIKQENLVITTELINTMLGSFCTIFSNNDSIYTLSVELNSKTGEAIGKIKHHVPTSKEDFTTTLKENIGDMFSFNYLLLKDRNVFNDQMQVTQWTKAHPDYSYRIYHNFSVTLENVSIEYSNMYY